MKIEFRIGAERGGPRKPEYFWSADPKARLLRPGRISGVRFLHPGSGLWLELGRPVGSNPQAAPATTKPHKSGQLSDISNRFWPKNRSYRKQTIKPRLTGARTAFSDSSFLRGVRVRRGGRRGMIQRDGQHFEISTRFWPKSRRYRKQTIKPFLPGATTTCRRASEL
jgi:hypothetical protein